MSVKKTIAGTIMKEFSFFLEAYRFCMTAGISSESISRRDWKTWTVKVPTK
jgi:hypothetical protein